VTTVPDRSSLVKSFLKTAGWESAQSVLLAGDASNRSYDRLDHDTLGRAVLMNAPPAKGEDTKPFVAITEWLLSAGLSAPKVIASDTRNGLLLLEDFGDDLFARLCTFDPSLERPLYEAAVDVLVSLKDKKPAADLAPYDGATYLREAQLLTEWYLPTVTGYPTEAEIAAEFDALIERACGTILNEAYVTVLRDYHSENLLWLPERSGEQRVGLLDYQDALVGHPAYDLVSLLEDARRDTSTELQRAMLDRYIASSGFDPDAFETAYNVLGAQRNIKIIGIFARLCLRDKKKDYLKYMPRVWAHLQRDLTDPVLADLKDWFARNVPEPTLVMQSRLRKQMNAN
jgi:aminoglycoside/choline kinase family phosphotransferase